MRGYVPTEDIYNQIEDYLQSKIKFICIKILNMREISQNVPQFDHIEKRSSGFRILRSQFFPGLDFHIIKDSMLVVLILNMFVNSLER